MPRGMQLAEDAPPGDPGDSDVSGRGSQQRLREHRVELRLLHVVHPVDGGKPRSQPARLEALAHGEQQLPAVLREAAVREEEGERDVRAEPLADVGRGDEIVRIHAVVLGLEAAALRLPEAGEDVVAGNFEVLVDGLVGEGEGSKTEDEGGGESKDDLRGGGEGGGGGKMRWKGGK